jgi:hypothetical protein
MRLCCSERKATFKRLEQVESNPDLGAHDSRGIGRVAVVHKRAMHYWPFRKRSLNVIRQCLANDYRSIDVTGMRLETRTVCSVLERAMIVICKDFSVDLTAVDSLLTRC